MALAHAMIIARGERGKRTVTRAERLIDAASDCFGEGAGEAEGRNGCHLR